MEQQAPPQTHGPEESEIIQTTETRNYTWQRMAENERNELGWKIWNEAVTLAWSRPEFGELWFVPY